MNLATVTNMLPIYAAAGRGQYAKALRLYLEQTAAHEVQYGALLKTFKVVGLHTVRYTDRQTTSGLVFGQSYRQSSD